MRPRLSSGRVDVGVGGWLHAPWRGVFSPTGLKQADELAFAASRRTSIEINAIHYKLQTPAELPTWADAAPTGSKFSVKGLAPCHDSKALPRPATSSSALSGRVLSELGEKSDLCAWQFPPFKRFDADDPASSSTCYRVGSTAKTRPCDRGAARELRNACLRRAPPRCWSRRGLYRRRDLAEHPSRHRRTSPMRGCSAATTSSGCLPAEGRLNAWAVAPSNGKGWVPDDFR